MKTFLTFVIALMLIPQFCFASNSESLKGIIQEYQYFVSVEWDQRDQVSLNQKRQETYRELEKLMDKGLSDEDIIAVTELSPIALKELQTIHPDDHESVLEFITRNYPQMSGASWNPDVVGGLLFFATVGALLGLFTLYAVSKNRQFNACVAANNGNEEPCIDR